MLNLEIHDDILGLLSSRAPPEVILQCHQDHLPDDLMFSGVYKDSYTKRLLFQLLTAGVYHNHSELVRTVLDSGCPVNLTDVYLTLTVRGFTVSFPRQLPQPLLVAIEQHDLAMVELLMSYGADIHEEHIRSNGDVVNAMDVVFEQDHLDIFYCLRHQYVRSRDRHDRNLLHIACKRNAFKCTEVLLSEGMIDVNEKDSRGYTPLMYGVRHGSHFVSLLLQTPVDVNLITHEGTALHLLAFPYIHPRDADHSIREMYQSLRLLVERGADVSLMSGNGNTPLSWVLARAGVYALNNHLDNATDADEYSAITIKACELLLEYSPTGINSVNNWLSMSTVMKNISELFTYLRNDLQDNFERNAVGSVTMNHQLLQRLLEFGMDPNTPANCLTHIRVGLQDLTLMEAVLSELCILAKTTNGQAVLSSDIFCKVGNILLITFQDFLNYNCKLRTDILYRALVKNHPSIWPFIELYLLRQSQQEYQALVTDLHSRIEVTPRMTEVNKFSLKTDLPRVQSLHHLARLSVYEALGSKLCPPSIATLGLPTELRKFVAFTTEIEH